ncbi:class I SAM-dependent methyltransferase [Janibacter sp. YB324]|uniref:class I SAM-dependent methyltransferase n=1 Tax=Janibacter sp. YB324 TaxID=2761047 RepID=UPI001627F045|nr:class I SAM-dependent methyltransferase [Janibacter sp. YB324]QNF93469.1 class I SAM-dependent methyltransferase [Janibacter sp. YB324]
MRRPPYVAPGHYYSPVTSQSDRERAIAWRSLPPVGVDVDEDGQRALMRDIGPLMAELPEDRWQTNGMYGRVDAAVLHAMLRHHRPRRLLEIGSGYSTAVALDVADRYLPDLDITCVEPNPERLRSRLRARDDVEVIERPVQDAPAEIFDRLSAGDFLFIDSTHVLKSGSDVAWLYLHVLPTLPPGIHVHVHDVHWPFEYPEPWLREGRDWTETYLLRAFLTHNDVWQVRLMTSWMWGQHPELVPPGLRDRPTGSLWMQRIRSAPPAETPDRP